MAFILFFAIGPTSIISFIGFLLEPDKTVPNPIEHWQDAPVDLLILSYYDCFV